MSLRQKLPASGDDLDRVAGITGFGWTVALLGYLGAVLGAGNGLVPNPQSLLYLGGVLFLATIALDRLSRSLSHRP